MWLGTGEEVVAWLWRGCGVRGGGEGMIRVICIVNYGGFVGL